MVATFPELDAAVIEKYFANIPILANATAAEILQQSFERIQRKLTTTADKLPTKMSSARIYSVLKADSV